MEPVATVSLPPEGKRSDDRQKRADLDWKSDGFTWRYRNRFQLEKGIAIRSYRLKAYGSLPKPITKMERHHNLRRQSLFHRQARRTRPVLRAPEQHGQKPQSAIESIRPDPQSVLLVRQLIYRENRNAQGDLLLPISGHLDLNGLIVGILNRHTQLLAHPIHLHTRDVVNA